MIEPEKPQLLLDGLIELRPNDKGQFDELVMYASPQVDCLVHAEMMDKGVLCIGFYPKGGSDERVVMWIRALQGKLIVTAEQD